MKLRMNRGVYFALGFLGCSVPISLVLVQAIAPALSTEPNEPMLASFGFQFLAVLTYPAGVLGTLVSLPAIYLGFATPTGCGGS